MKKGFIVAFALLASATTIGQVFSPVQRYGEYSVQVNIMGRSDDKVDVKVVPPIQNADSVVYALPKIVPGTYDISDFGQFVSGFKAIDSRGAELPIRRLDVNRWVIQSGKALYAVEYEVRGTDADRKTDIFLPGGTAIADSAVLLNTFGYVGFMENQENLPYRFNVHHDKYLVGTTALDIRSTSDFDDEFHADNYFELHDRPLIYAPDNVASTMVAGAEITVGVYSPSHTLDAQELLDGLAPVFDAASTYLGGTLPTDQYVVLIWGMTAREVIMNPSVGALEHFTSTVVTMPDLSDELYVLFEPGVENPKIQFLRDIVAHEFFHIVTPLNIHSEQIHNYDFIHPQMSEHLWFYEGLTEYNSMIAQVRAGIISEEAFMRLVVEKMEEAEYYNPHIPMTLRSAHALDVFADQYGDVYQKGALIGMALDMHLRMASNGEKGLVDLLMELKNEFGPDTFFVDDQLFDIIIDKTPEGTSDFLYGHIAGTEPLHFAEYFEAMGYEYIDSELSYRTATPDWNVSFDDEAGHYVVSNWNVEDPFTRNFGLAEGDRILRWNGEKLKENELDEVLNSWVESTCAGAPVTLKVERTLSNGREVELELQSITTLATREVKHILRPAAQPTEEQLELKKAWINQ